MRREIAGCERCSAAAAVNGQEGEKRIAVHVPSMQKADDG